MNGGTYNHIVPSSELNCARFSGESINELRSQLGLLASFSPAFDFCPGDPEAGANPQTTQNTSNKDTALFRMSQLVLRFIHLLLSWYIYASTITKTEHETFSALINKAHSDVKMAVDTEIGTHQENDGSQILPRNKRKGIFARIHRLRLILQIGPGQLRNAISQPTRKTVPVSEIQLLNSLPNRQLIPTHLGAIFKVHPFVTPRPKDLPQPYVGKDRQIVVPKTKNIRRSLCEQTEFLVMKSAHYSAEKVRIFIELARLITWSAASGIRTVTVYEESGNLWQNLSDISSTVGAECFALYGDLSRVPSIKIVDRQTGDYAIIPSGESVASPTSDYNLATTRGNMYKNHTTIDAPEALTEGVCTPIACQIAQLTVFLSSRRDTSEKVISIIKEAHYSSAENPLQMLDRKLELFACPSIIIRAGGEREFVQKLDGFPAFGHDSEPLFYARHEKFGFNFFLRAISAYVASIKDDQLMDKWQTEESKKYA
ncbi:hypothetical protein BABINDRAFT_164737 [Babjeviella inositovora NRRL Y-12698]|uniref:Uncharacterized protein n=1 Tax=Babjeviella inositovora NRRL Y-12698 TaxID=984486 RepID=A0A1E3QZB9_9ASCO|nr:uncharacterized protein BABINDRAFT_164737 [Babjeviella inositovora NRRL Y-12698]ODQ83023.1 hypothetical protein BABINDRAFT_164737 [Babjeviella inositovora NRRL Y-12698]